MSAENSEFAEFLLGGSEISKAYAALARIDVPRELDALILARAAHAIDAHRLDCQLPIVAPATVVRARRFAPLALAASVLLCVSAAIALLRNPFNHAAQIDAPRILPAKAQREDRPTIRRAMPSEQLPASEPVPQFLAPAIARPRVITSDPAGSRPSQIGAPHAAEFPVATLPAETAPSRDRLRNRGPELRAQ
jgi:hypothetical protein